MEIEIVLTTLHHKTDDLLQMNFHSNNTTHNYLYLASSLSCIQASQVMSPTITFYLCIEVPQDTSL